MFCFFNLVTLSPSWSQDQVWMVDSWIPWSLWLDMEAWGEPDPRLKLPLFLSHPWLWRRRACPAGVWMPWPTHPRCVCIPWGPSGWGVSVLVAWSALERMGLGRKCRLAWKMSLRLFGQGIPGRSKVPRGWSRSSGPQSFWHQGSVRGRQFTDWGGKGWFGDDSSALHLLWTLFDYYYISSPSDYWAWDPGGWGPLV